jgi:hypothetical protein
MIDPATGTLTFISTVGGLPNPSMPGAVPGGNGATGTTGVLIPPGAGNGTPRARPVPVSTPTPSPTSSPRPSTADLASLQRDFTETKQLIQMLQTTIDTVLTKDLNDAQANLAALKAGGKDTTAQAAAIAQIQTQMNKTLPDQIAKAQLKLKDLQNKAMQLGGTLR